MSAHTFVAHTTDLCQALAAAAPFANDKVPGFGTVRVFVDPTNIYVGATNGSAMGLALASTFGLDGITSDGEPFEPDLIEFDLLPAQARAIVSLFKAGADVEKQDGEEMGAELRVEVTDHDVTVVDASGLLEGQSVTFPRPPTEDNAAAVLVSTHRKVEAGPAPDKKHPPRYYAAQLALLVKASKVYGEDLIFEHRARPDVDRSGSTLVRCGESFLGVLVDASKTDEGLAVEDIWRAGWDSRLGPLARRALELTQNDNPKEK